MVDLNDCLILVGIGAIIAGLLIISWPLAVVFGGFLFMAIGLRRTGGRKIL